MAKEGLNLLGTGKPVPTKTIYYVRSVMPAYSPAPLQALARVSERVGHAARAHHHTVRCCRVQLAAVPESQHIRTTQERMGARARVSESQVGHGSPLYPQIAACIVYTGPLGSSGSAVLGYVWRYGGPGLDRGHEPLEFF